LQNKNTGACETHCYLALLLKLPSQFIFPVCVGRDFSYIRQSAYALYSNLAQDLPGHEGYHRLKEPLMRRYLIPPTGFLLGLALMSGVYFGILTWAQDWDFAASQFWFNRWYIVPIWVGFGIQTALYSILHFRLFIPTITTGHTGAMVGANGATSTTAMVACCIHHVADVLPILGLSAAATFLARYQRPFMLVGLGMNIIVIMVMLIVLYRERQKSHLFQKSQLVLETK
jgi:hypothetical protein